MVIAGLRFEAGLGFRELLDKGSWVVVTIGS